MYARQVAAIARSNEVFHVFRATLGETGAKRGLFGGAWAGEATPDKFPQMSVWDGLREQVFDFEIRNPASHLPEGIARDNDELRIGLESLTDSEEIKVAMLDNRQIGEENIDMIFSYMPDCLCTVCCRNDIVVFILENNLETPENQFIIINNQ